MGVLLVFSVVLVALWSLNGAATQRTRASVSAAVLSMFECIVFMTLSAMEHRKSIGPPLLLDAYLFISVLFDAVRARTLWLNNVQLSISIIFTITTMIKLAVLILEESGKRRWLLPSKRPWSKEVTSGIFSRTLFAWLDRMMWKGYSSSFTVTSLPDIDCDLLSESVWSRVGPKLEKREYNSRQIPDTACLNVLISIASEGIRGSLIWIAFWTLKWPLVAPVLPYLVLVASQLAQPYLISTVLGYVGSPYDGSQEQKNIGYGLVAGYGLVYICIAVSRHDQEYL